MYSMEIGTLQALADATERINTLTLGSDQIELESGEIDDLPTLEECDSSEDKEDFFQIPETENLVTTKIEPSDLNDSDSDDLPGCHLGLMGDPKGKERANEVDGIVNVVEMYDEEMNMDTTYQIGQNEYLNNKAYMITGMKIKSMFLSKKNLLLDLLTPFSSAPFPPRSKKGARSKSGWTKVVSSFYGDSRRNGDGTWKGGMDSSMIPNTDRPDDDDFYSNV